MARKMHFTFNQSTTHVNGRWNLPGARGDRTFPDVMLYVDVARVAERLQPVEVEPPLRIAGGALRPALPGGHAHRRASAW